MNNCCNNSSVKRTHYWYLNRDTGCTTVILTCSICSKHYQRTEMFEPEALYGILPLPMFPGGTIIENGIARRTDNNLNEIFIKE